MTVSTPDTLGIGAVSARTGFSDAALRYYERIGLIPPVDRDPASGHRRYGEDLVRRLEALGCLRASGMGVAEMRTYLHNLGPGSEAARRQRELFAAQAEHLDGEIARLTRRLGYLRAKVDLWSARERGDAEAERHAVESVEDVLRAWHD